MSAVIIDGKLIAREVREMVKDQIEVNNLSPTLAVILVGDDPASHVYVGNKIRACAEVGIESIERKLPAAATEKDIAKIIDTLNADTNIDGILMQLPLPEHLSDVQESLVQRIAPEKDVDGLTVANAGKLFLGEKDGLVPCTPQGSLHLIHSVTKDLSGKHAVVIGRSNLFGKPMAQLLLQENCTVTMAHSRTKNLDTVCKDADILVAAVGRPKMIKADWVKDGAVVIDVGINRLEDGTLCGDIDYDEVKNIASAITPVPGGVGPMTISCLMQNTLRAHQAK
ncbi:MAG: bifunctional methylenetetrahydrofolate dehydrogenase/methenyltetrahydrofolate cyclohydrolase FolD [Micavibrio sp.]|nr:bifunctional methylenetetrahydrofolate dehydrogenase/methenyltetrahydrofolate cyclohydrolase FolD [Micavibrio sp.]|tara:strand:+ start:588154 stop:588999 length:846 start_codon:yes stop_codon:yes gene_type:complete